MQVQELMATDVVTVGRNDDLRLVDDIMAERRIRHIPVLDDDQIVGIVTQRDVFNARMSSTMGYGEKGQRAFLHTVYVKEIMRHPVITISPEAALTDAVGLMLTHGIGCLPVLQNDQLVGIITKTNLLHRLRALSATESEASAQGQHSQDKKHAERGLPNVMPY